jgi:hypothetical protein
MGIFLQAMFMPSPPANAAAVWIKVRNPSSIAVQRERSEMWNR